MNQEPTFEKVVFHNPSFPSISIQNPVATEETYYGRFRSIVKQRFFGLKLEEEPFMEFIDSNPEFKDKLGEFTQLMDKVKDDYVNFLKKTYPDKIQKRKNKRKGKKKDSGIMLEVPKLDSDCYSSDNSAIYSSSNDLDTTTTNELVSLRTKIENIRKDFTFDSIENVAKNIHLFDDAFGKVKTEHHNRRQMDQLQKFQLSFGAGGGVNFASLGGPSGNDQPKEQETHPPCLDYFNELYRRWDKALEEVD